jgi:hypothetical protein
MLPTVSHHETGNNHQNTEFHNTHKKQCTGLHNVSDIDTTVFNNTMQEAVNFTFADLYSNTHPSSLGMSGEPANFEPADLCSATHPCSPIQALQQSV